MSWSTLQLRDLESLIKPVDSTVDTVSTAISVINTALETVVGILKTISLILIDEITLESVAIKTAVGTINSILDDFVAGGSAHLLTLRLQRNTNAGIANAIAASLQDADDVYKPMYGPGNAVAGLLIVYGAPSGGIVELLEGILTLQNLFGKFTHGLDGFAMPIPENLKTRVINTPRVDTNNISWIPSNLLGIINPLDSADIRTFGRVRGSQTGPISVLLQWDPKTGENFIDSLGLNVSIETIQIFKHTESLNATIGSGILPVGQLNAYLIEDYPYCGFTSVGASYVDDEIDEENDKVLHYAVGYRISFKDDEGNTTLSQRLYVSKSIPINVGQVIKTGVIQSSRAGTPPDWQAIVNPFQLIPGLVDFVQGFKEILAELEASVAGAATNLKKFIEFLELVIAENIRAVTDLLNQIKRIINIIKSINIGASVFPFAADTGGNGAIISSVNDALTNTSLPDRPQFDAPSPELNGENSLYLMGAILMVAGGTGAGDIKAATTLFSLIGGSLGGANSLFDEIGAEISDVGTTIKNTIKALEALDWKVDMSSPEAIAATQAFSLATQTDGPEEENTPIDPLAGTEDDILTRIC